MRQALCWPALASLGLSLLSGCAVPPPRPAPAPPPPPPLRAPPPAVRRPPHRLHPLLVPHPARKPAPPPQPPRKQAVARPPPPALPPPPAPAPPPLPVAPPPLPVAPPRTGALVGLDQRKATRLFGRAADKIEQPPATIWRYKTPTCELDLFFYLDLRSGRMRTLHYVFKGDVGGAAKRRDCLRAIMAAGGK